MTLTIPVALQQFCEFTGEFSPQLHDAGARMTNQHGGTVDVDLTEDTLVITL